MSQKGPIWSVGVLKLVPSLVQIGESHSSDDGKNQENRDDHEVQVVLIT